MNNNLNDDIESDSEDSSLEQNSVKIPDKVYIYLGVLLFISGAITIVVVISLIYVNFAD